MPGARRHKSVLSASIPANHRGQVAADFHLWYDTIGKQNFSLKKTLYNNTIILFLDFRDDATQDSGSSGRIYINGEDNGTKRRKRTKRAWKSL